MAASGARRVLTDSQDSPAHPAEKLLWFQKVVNFDARRQPSGMGVGVDNSEQRGYDSAVSAFVEAFAADLTEAGMPRMPSRVFACLLAEDSGVLSAAELAERLQISPAAVSGAVRYLAQVHMVSREREPGSRRERYRVQADIWLQAFTNRDHQFLRWGSTLRQGAEAVGHDTPAGRRIADTADFFAFIREELASLMDRWRAHQAEQATD